MVGGAPSGSDAHDDGMLLEEHRAAPWATEPMDPSRSPSRDVKTAASLLTG
jgi:hypothetical protein